MKGEGLEREAKAALLQHFEIHYPQNKEGLADFITGFAGKTYPKNSFIVSNGAFDNKLRFLKNGIVREYYSHRHKETNINFYTCPQFLTDFTSFINNLPTRKNQHCLSEVYVLEMDGDRYNHFLNKYSCSQSFIKTVFTKLLKAKEKEEYNRLTKAPEEIYEELLLHRKDWMLHIPQYHIASYLGITPETLSRIRKRIY